MVKLTIITQHGLNAQRWIFISAILFLKADSNGVEVQSKSCTGQQATTNRNSFNFRKFGNASNLEKCVDFCCRDDACELAIFSRGFHCFGVSCNGPKLCHKILDHLLMKDERELQQSSGNPGTDDFIRHTSQVVNPVCPQRFVPSFQVLLLGTSISRSFHKMQRHSVDAVDCSAQCCESPDCLLSFIDDSKCYGVTGDPAGKNFTALEQERTLSLQVAIVDRNKEVSRSLDDEDEDPDELGSDEADNRHLPAEKASATFKSQSKPGKSGQGKTTKFNSKLQQTQVSVASTNSRNKGIDGRNSSKYTPRPIKGVKVTSTSHGRATYSYSPRLKGATKHDKSRSQVSKDMDYRKNTVIIKKTEYNPKVIVKNSHGIRDVTPKVPERVKPIKTVTTMEVKPAEKSWIVTGGKRVSQNTHSEANLKSTHNVTVNKESKESQGSRLIKTHQENDFTSYGSSSPEKESSSRFSELRVKEISSQEHDGYTSASGEDEEFSGESDVSGENDFSGNPDSSRDDSVLSGDDGYRKGVVKDVSGEGEEWTGAQQGLSSGESDLSGEDEVLSGNSGDLSGHFSSIHKFRKTVFRSRGKSEGKIRNAVHEGDQDSKIRERGKSREEESKPRSKMSARMNKAKVQKLKKTDIVEDPDELGSNNGDSEGTSKKHLTLPQKTSFRKTTRHGVKTHSKRLNSKEGGAKNIDLVADLEDLGSDKNASGNATLGKLEKLPSRDSKKIKKERLKSKGRQKIKTKLVEDPDELGSDEADSKAPSRNVERLPKKLSTLKATQGHRKTNNDHLKSRQQDNIIKVGDVEDPDDLGSDDEENIKGNPEEQNKIPSRKNKDLPLKASGEKLKSRMNGTNIGNEQINFKKEVRTRNKIDLVEDLNELGADDNDGLRSAHEERQTKSREVVVLSQQNDIDHAISPVSKHANNSVQKYSGGNLHSSEQKHKTKTIDIFSKENERPKNSDNRLKNISTFQSRANHKGSPVNMKLVKGKANLVKKSGSTKEAILQIKDTTVSSKHGEGLQHIVTTKEPKAKPPGAHVQVTVTPSLSTKGKYVKQLRLKKNIGKTIDTKENGSRRVDHGVKIPQSKPRNTARGTPHQGQAITKKTHTPGTRSKKANKASPSSQADLRNGVKKTENRKVSIKPYVKKNENTLKARMASAAQVISKSGGTISSQKRKSIEITSKKPVISNNSHGKETIKQTKTPLSVKSNTNSRLGLNSTERKVKTMLLKSSSKLGHTDDLMKYAHRKGPAKYKPTVRSGLRNSSPATKGAVFVKSTMRQQRLKMQGQPNVPFYHNATKTVSHSGKAKFLPEKQPHVQRSPSASFQKKEISAAKNVKTTPSAITLEHVSSKKSHSLVHHAHLSTGKNRFNKALLSMKQRSNENILNGKEDFLSHFYKDSNRSDGLEFSAESRRKHHKRTHSKHEDSIDVENLGDADFDIMMSNDIPHKDFPKKAKRKEKDNKREGEVKDREHGKKTKGDAKHRKKVKEEEAISDESDEKTSTHYSTHKHKGKGKKNDHHHHHRKTENGDNDDERHYSKEDSDHSKHATTGLHNHGKSVKSIGEDKVRHHHKKHRHKDMAVSKYGNDNSDNNSEKSGKHQKKHGDDAKSEGITEVAEKTEHRHHHRHKTHAKKYDSNVWVGKIIPGKIKLTYEDGNDEKRDRIHKVRDGKEGTRHERKHSVETPESRKDDSGEIKVINSHTHSHHLHYRRRHRHYHDASDDYKMEEKQTKHHSDREEDEEREKTNEDSYKEQNIRKKERHTAYRNEKGKDEGKRKDREENNEGKQDDAEKRTDVNYEVVKPDRHRFGHHKEEETSHAEAQDEEKENSHNHYASREEEDSSSKVKNVVRSDDDDDDDDDESRKNDDNRSKDERDENDSNDEKEEHHHSREKTKENRVVLGEDSEAEDNDEEQHAVRRERTHGRRHGFERDGDEDGRYHRQDRKSQYLQEHRKHTNHIRRGHERQSEWKPRHLESHFEPKEVNSDDDEYDNNDDEKRRNFRKSSIYHKKEDDERRPKQHHFRARNKEEQQEHDTNVNSEYHNKDHEREFHADEHYRHPSYHHRHHRYKARFDNDRKEEKPEDRYELNGDEYRHQMREHNSEHFLSDHKINEDRENEKLHHHEEEAFQRHHHVEEYRPNEDEFRNFQREKEAHHEDGQERWKVKGYHDRDFQGDSKEKDSYDHDFKKEERPLHHFHNYPDYDGRRKFKTRKKKKGHWKSRHYLSKEGHEYEDSGGLFDSSSWNLNNIDNDDDYYGGEGNYDKRKYRKKQWRHKHRKDRQSYEYWGYGNQNPYYYDYRYHNLRSRYRNYPLQTTPPFDWRKRYEMYDGWKPKPKHWYPDAPHRKGSWRHHATWRHFQERKPSGYQWNTYYSDSGNGDDRDTNGPRPTSYLRDATSFFRPTMPRWQQPETTGRRFIGNNWSPGHTSGPGKQFQDWSQNTASGTVHQDGSVYNPQQHPPYGAQLLPQPDVARPDGLMHPIGVQSKYVAPAPQQTQPGISNQTRFRPTVRRQYPATPPSIVASPTNISQIKNMMDKLSSPPSTPAGQQTNSDPNAQNKLGLKDVLPKINLTSSDQEQDKNRLNGFFKEENAGKKSDILRPANSSKELPVKNTSSANISQHTQQNLPKTTLVPQTAHAANTTTVPHTSPIQISSNQTSKVSHAAQNKSSTAVPTQKITTTVTPTAPNFGDESQTDDSSETGKKHRKHRDPVCIAGKTTDDLTLLRGKRAGNFTNIGDVGDFGRCIKRCCQKQNCDLAFKSAETCFLVSCFSQESCQTSPAIDDVFKPQMSFVRRRSRDRDKDMPGQDGDDEWNDKISPSGIHEVCEAEKALGILWKKTVAGDYSSHPCPRDAKGFVKRRCEADSRWLPPNFSDCVSSDYQALYDKSRMLANGADPSPLIRELSQLTTQNIDNSLIFGGDLDRATDIMTAIVQHNSQTDSSDMTRHDVENFVRASSNLLDMTNQQEWLDIQKNKPGTAGVLRSMEMFALQAIRRLSLEDMAEPAVTDNIIIKMDRKSPGDAGLTFPDFSNPKIDRWDARHDIIALPSSLFDQETNIASISFKTLPYLLPDSNVSTGLGPNSKILSAVMYPQPQGKITPPVTIVLSHIKRRRGNPKCVFWDYTLNPHRGGAWSSRGCWLAFNNRSHSICQCSHLSHFAVLMDLSSDESLQKEQKRERTMALMWIGIPVLIVGVIGGLYMSFSWNRKSGISSSVARPSASLNEKTGLLGQRVVTSQVREEFPPSPTRDLYRALSPGYSPTGDLEWQDEFDFDVESGDQGFKQMLLPKLQLLQNQLINEFYDTDKIETKRKLMPESKLLRKTKTAVDSPVLSQPFPFEDLGMIQTEPRTTPDERERETSRSLHKERSTQIQAEPKMKIDNPIQNGAVHLLQKLKTSCKKQKLRVRFADDGLPGRNRTDEDKERFRRLQRMERRVFAQHLSRWNADSHLNLSAE